jgi:hypothetical protein
MAPAKAPKSRIFGHYSNVYLSKNKIDLSGFKLDERQKKLLGLIH